MKKATTAERLKFIMESRNLKQVDILRLCEPYTKSSGVKVNKNDLSQYVSGKTTPGQFKLTILAQALNVSETWLMGWDTSATIPTGFSPVPDTVKRPRLGKISCGIPIMSEENFDGYDEVPKHIDCDFTLVCDGDSMTGARILDGDIVYIKQQPMVENGEIAAVLVDGCEKLLKRVYITETSITLQAENPKYSPLIFIREEMNRVSIIGKAVAFTSVVR